MPRPHPTQVRQIVMRQYLMGIDIQTIRSLTGIPTTTIYGNVHLKRVESVVVCQNENLYHFTLKSHLFLFVGHDPSFGYFKCVYINLLPIHHRM